MSDNDPASRRDVLRRGLRSLGRFLAGAVEHVEANLPLPRAPLRPPGAVANFNDLCTACGKCITACWPGTLFPSGPASERPGAPTFDPRKKPCYMCPTVPCAAACPSGALEVVLPVTLARMGTAEVQTSRCWAWLGMECTKCVDACPAKHVAIGFDASRRPVVNADACTGCGMCEKACPENPSAIRVVPR